MQQWRFSDLTWTMYNKESYTEEEALEIVSNIDRSRQSVFPYHDKDFFHYEFKEKTWRIHFQNAGKMLVRTTTWYDLDKRLWTDTEADKVTLIKKLASAIEGKAIVRTLDDENNWTLEDIRTWRHLVKDKYTVDEAEEIIKRCVQDGTRMYQIKNSSYFYFDFDAKPPVWKRAMYSPIFAGGTIVNIRYGETLIQPSSTVRTACSQNHDLTRINFVEALGDAVTIKQQ